MTSIVRVIGGLFASVSLFIFSPDALFAQLVAFPGAEGAARLATGGRGGDVYTVTNLNDSGPGSLRNGITTAGGTGRTIVFDVAGTIQLQSSLDFNGKSNITIAGQTAPGGGITLANQRLHIDDANNVIVQFLRIRPGNTFGSTDPDAIWVHTSTNVMIDHVTASWGVDETISPTHDSHNVTVQWSYITQGLYEGGHSKGDGHSYGSLVNGGDYTFHHNLYAHNKSRNPRPQDAGNRNLRLDFVNNVIYNPQDRYGYSDSNDPYEMNMVGNYGIKGPRTNNSVNSLMRPDDVDSKIYFSSNAMDNVRDGVLNGAAVGTENFHPNDDWTQLANRVNLPEVNTTDARQAYIQVLSRGGMNMHRDSVDRRLIRTLFNQTEGSINTQADWGDWPTLPIGSAAADSNNDGVPNWYAEANGFDPASTSGANLLHKVTAPSGYTWLETYIHSLTPYAYAPASTQPITVSTAFGRGADALVSENGGASGGNGTGNTLDVHWAGATGNVNQAILMKFDLSQVQPGSITDARLELTAAADISGSHDFKIYALEHDATGWDWDEAAVQFNDAPGLAVDGNSGTLGIDPVYDATNPADLPDVLTLGTLTIGNTPAGGTVTFDNANLAVFLNLAAYFEGTEQEGLVTIILEQTNNASLASFHSKEGNPALAPTLVIDGLEAQVVAVPGDFDDDGDVDGADFVVWQTNFPTQDGATLATRDADGDGDVDGADFVIWQTNFPFTPSAGPAAAVPEPSTWLLSLLALAGGARSAAPKNRRRGSAAATTPR